MKLLLLLFICVLASIANSQQYTEEEMWQILNEYNTQTISYCKQQVQANWNVQTNVGEEQYELEQRQITIQYANYTKGQYDLYFKNAVVNDYQDEDIRRRLSLLKNIGTAALSNEDLDLLTATRTNMSGIYNKARICPYNITECDLQTQGLTLDPDIEQLMARLATNPNSETYDELLYIWEEWHNNSGSLMREQYKTYVDLYNKAAIANNFSDAGEMWRSRYEYDGFVELVDTLWSEVEPLYDELHRYVRYKLTDVYGDKLHKADSLLPAHVFGNMWAQNWAHLYDLTRPFSASDVNVTANMIASNFTEYKMYEMSDEFYKSLGLPTSNMSYNDPSIIIKPPEPRVIACHASAWDFCDGSDFRIKQCTKINMEDFLVVHHEMGHIMYYIMYKDQPLIYRTGANPGFHEAIGDTIALSVATPKHLIDVDLLDNFADSEEDNINALYKMALQRVAFLPFGLLIDKWRWDVFDGNISESEWNTHWWDLREKYQKIRAPSFRGEEFFDPGAKYHIPADSQYIAYFVAHILEFSFYRSLCIAAEQYNPDDPNSILHKCDFYQRTAAGDKLREGLSLGYSKHWSEALHVLTGSREISSSALREYFEPLHIFLKEHNDKRQRNDMPEMLALYEKEGSEMCNKYVQVEWAVATDSENEQFKADFEKVVIENAEFTRHWHESTFKGANPDDYDDELIKRQLKYLVHLGRDALDAEELSDLTNTQTAMEKIYNLARICPFTMQNCDINNKNVSLSLDPELTEIMATSTNYDELKWVWEQWHDKSGGNMRDGYSIYVDLNNKAAQLNNHSDAGKMWLDAYEDENFVAKVDSAWSEVEPLYNELHTYVRRKLKAMYGDKMDDSDELIPAHLLGNMWAQSWVNLYEHIKPFPDGSSIDVTQNLLNKNISVYEMFEKSNEFFENLGLPNNRMSYNESRGAIIIKPEDKTITCHASAWDFCDGEDFRIKMCTVVNQEDFVTVHHEMGHINYFILYKDKPLALRTGANPGFHEAVGDLIALSVSTPQHLVKIGYLENYRDTEDDNINALFKMALEKIAFIPFGLLIDKWRWDVFSGVVPQSQWNQHWWALRRQYQKLKPPSPRSEVDFDPGAKYHVPADVPYIRYFVSHIIQFQFHRAACLAAGQYAPNDTSKPLHKCDIDGSKEAGDLIKSGLSLGLAKHWSEALKAMTNQSEMSGAALNEYFAPLYEWLKTKNEEDGKGSSAVNRVNIFVFGIIFAVKILFF